MAQVRKFTWSAAGLAVLLVGAGLILWMTPSRQTSSAQDGPRPLPPLISRGYTDAPAGTALIAGDPAGGGVLIELRITDGQKVKRDEIIAVLSNYPKADIAVRTTEAELVKTERARESMVSGYRTAEIAMQEVMVKSAAEEVKLKTQYTDKKAKAINFELYVQQLNEVEQSFGALVKQLPNRSEIDALLTDINQAGLGRGLQFELFRPAPQEKMAEFYAELPIRIRITGTYHDMGAFASDIAQLPRIVTLNDLVISNDKGTLVLEGDAKTFRYLDEEEIAKQRAAAKAKGKK